MLEAGKMYHLYNRGNNRDNLFYKRENYHYFIRQFDKYLSDHVGVYAYCLLPNHFHFLIKIKEDTSDTIALSDGIAGQQRNSIDLSKKISEQFRRFFISYSQAINKQEKRVGSLFQKRFKIKEVTNDNYFSYLIYYIHANPQRHGLIHDFRDWNYSSYHSIITKDHSKIMKEEVIDWFGNAGEYKRFHDQQFDFRELESMKLDD